jgi:hypothetical protein
MTQTGFDLLQGVAFVPNLGRMKRLRDSRVDLIYGNLLLVSNLFFDALAKSLQIVMPGLIRHPKRIDFNGFRPSPE